MINDKDYLNYFASDRRHMKINDDASKVWLAPPPSYECIKGPKALSSHNLSIYWNMSPDSTSDNSKYGDVLTEDLFYNLFSSK